MYKYDADWGVWVWHDEANKKRRPKGSGTTTPELVGKCRPQLQEVLGKAQEGFGRSHEEV